MQTVTPIQIRLQIVELAAIDSYRRTRTNPPSRPHAIRKLLRQALGERFGSAAVSTEAHP